MANILRDGFKAWNENCFGAESLYAKWNFTKVGVCKCWLVLNYSDAKNITIVRALQKLLELSNSPFSIHLLKESTNMQQENGRGGFFFSEGGTIEIFKVTLGYYKNSHTID